MSAYPEAEIQVQAVRRRGISPVQFAAAAVLLAVLGLSTIWFTMISLWTLWTTDALKSIGMVIPLVSLILVLREWRGLGWQASGTWWGLVLLVVTTAVARIQQQTILIMVVSPTWATVLPPPSLVLLGYGSGMVLLLGGVRLYRAALFPILLLWFANPVPHVFTSLVDLPLQHVSAHVARVFAMHLGHTLPPDQLRLMFTPDFGMFIAPGCDGIRGSVTMGFIALIAGYIYRFRWYANGLVVLGAVLLGYAFNLVRLCVLVLYYAVALHFPSLQGKAENADYVIGALLFLFATIMLFTVIARLRDTRNPAIFEGTADRDLRGHGDRSQAQYIRLAAAACVVLFGCVGLGRAKAMIQASTASAAEITRASFPAHLGAYTLSRSWNEADVTGPVIYVWGQYDPPGTGTPIAIGVSPVPNWHDPVLCHTVRGQDPLWQGELAFAGAGAGSTSFSSAFYNDGITRHIEASTLCRGGRCGEFTTGRTHFGLVYTHPDPRSLLSQSSEIPVRVLVRAEVLDMGIPDEAARQQLTEELGKFLAKVSLDQLTRPYSR